MSSIELATNWLKNEGKAAFARLEEKTAELYQIAKQYGMYHDFPLYDPVRLTLNTRKIGVSGTTAASFFKEDGIEPDYYDSDYVVFILNPFFTDTDFLRIKNAVEQVTACKKDYSNILLPVFPKPKAVMSVRQAVFAKSQLTELDQALGRVAAEPVCPCPPGIPAVIPGELIEQEAVDYLKQCGFKQIKTVNP